MFPVGAGPKNTPMDGLAIFIETTWEKIRTQKELNLPDQRIMVASLRCNELKEESLELVREPIERLKLQSVKTKIANFSNQCLTITKDALAHYDEYAHQYDKGIYEKVKKEIVELLLKTHLYPCFDNQIKLIRQSIFDKFDKDLRRHSTKDTVNEDFANYSESLYQEMTTFFKKESATLVLEGSGWGQQVLIHDTDLQQQLNSLITHAREKEIDKL